MRCFTRLVFLALSLSFTLPVIGASLQVGDQAPDFRLQASDGKTYQLADYRGKQAVVIAWFPRAYTSGCTIECKSLAENGHLIRKYDVSYFMASVDPLEDNIGFAEETGADFPLLSDPTKETARAYGVLHMLGFAKRHTYYIAVDGTILKIDTHINPATSAQDMAATLADLGIVKAGADSSKSTASVETARLNTWLNAAYDEELAFSPMKLTKLGRKNLYDQMDDYSEAALDAKFAWREKSVSQLKDEFDYTRLTSEGKISYDYWVYRLERARAQKKYRRHNYIFEQQQSRQTKFPKFLINDHSVDSDTDMVAYISRIEGSGRAIGQLLQRAKLAAEEGIRPPRFAYYSVIEQSRKVIGGAPFEDKTATDNALWEDAKQKISVLEEAQIISAARALELRASTRAALRGNFQTNYVALIAWMEQDIANSDEQPKGAHTLPDGDAYYAHRLAINTSSSKSADDIHAVGLAEVARIRGEMESIMKQTGFKGDMQAFINFVRDDKQFYFANNDVGRAQYIAETERLMARTTALLPQYFGVLPIAGLEIRRVEAFRERDGGAAHYNKGRPDGSRAGIYYMHLSNMSALNRTALQSVAYHEGVSGHHLQSSLALESRRLPVFRTNVWYSSYGEGWALYAELLAKEMGVYDDLYYDYGRLVQEMWRAVRLVIDTGMHSRGWSEQRAVDYFMANAAIPELKIRAEVRRYLVWPGQATSYKMGMLNILEMRANAREVLDDKFDISGFHDALLGGGTLPNALLARRVNDWVEAQLN